MLDPAILFIAIYPEDTHIQDYCFHIIYNSKVIEINKCLFIGNWLNYAISIQLSTMQL